MDLDHSTHRKPSVLKKITTGLLWPFRLLGKWLGKTNLTFWIVVSVIFGILLGKFAPTVAMRLKPFADIFIAMVKCLVTPLIFSTLVVGIAGHGDDLKAVGRLALKSFIYFEVVTTLALVVGLVFVNLFKPGVGINLDNVSKSEGEKMSKHDMSWEAELKKIVPTSFYKAAADNEVLQIVFCSLVFAVALIKVKSREHRVTMLAFLDSLAAIMFDVTALVMMYAPIGIGAALAATIGQNGLEVLINLGKLVGCLYGALVGFVLVILLPIALLARVPLMPFIRAVGRPFLLAFTTASSEAALPIAMENLQAMGVPKNIVAFVLPAGYSFNLDGTTLYLSLAGVFAAQAGNVDFPLGQQILMMFTLILTSKGVAAIPRASLIVLSAALDQFGLPLETIAVIMGVDAFMDMARTSINVLGNCLASVVIARWEGVFPAKPNLDGSMEASLSEKELEADLSEDLDTQSVHSVSKVQTLHR
ncbi:hypothetical protein H4R33_006865 [Dimargaris cristalligena]|uniref:Amino acid transporter n=1 Tax=Dimargaris cristalligena TaxID=215637 RepID=A0A4P9ZKC4_9FUNG|nr:hypothetical protein H4R33_006865 [Dimargaris cristalligena]RKP33535.1 sodium:dicarboxylate symporter [Dimargaris cristalligena]|eukprot:RKP33535.1 sodium:dicarboxylate symporter [Dimargaris cristalligena]